MPFQNRVDPYGQLHAVPERGAWLGNRGILHDETQRVVALWRLKRWLICTLRFKDRHRAVFTPHRYSELFFLDEATAFAAGHRPCAECRRTRYNEYRAVWVAAGLSSSDKPGADEIDERLHAERIVRGGVKRTYRAAFASLAPGTMIDHGGAPHLIWNGKLWPWSFAGYAAPLSAPNTAALVTVLTPQSTVRAFRAGFRPQVHESAD